MAIDTPMKRFSMLNMAGGAVYPRLFQPDGAVDADDRAFLLRLYGGNPFDAPADFHIEIVNKMATMFQTSAKTTTGHQTSAKTTTGHQSVTKTTHL